MSLMSDMIHCDDNDSDNDDDDSNDDENNSRQQLLLHAMMISYGVVKLDDTPLCPIFLLTV